ncbi:uncharacterized protein N7500_003559 [Penicillium coprophilum]|uniref:uncharacterized protein n=1 Tax=Penicillium coprophilum TaxID=36646 RepID=UPI002395D078|nr:uncharacterized protein N7500_003559 [Penicillium coprophilum]KAJ5170776.1 hypothetical protein N7500_003559 [Penicillium coprophilum]
MQASRTVMLAIIYHHLKANDVLEGKRLFKGIGPLGVQEYDELRNLGHIAALLGPPPKALLEKGARAVIDCETNGQFEGTNVPSLKFNSADSICYIRNDDKRMFVDFVQRMIKWNPGERSTAME